MIEINNLFENLYSNENSSENSKRIQNENMKKNGILENENSNKIMKNNDILEIENKIENNSNEDAKPVEISNTDLSIIIDEKESHLCDENNNLILNCNKSKFDVTEIEGIDAKFGY